MARSFPHLDTIADESAQRTLRLLWDRVNKLDSAVSQEDRASARINTAVTTALARLTQRSILVEKTCNDNWPASGLPAEPLPPTVPLPPTGTHPNPIIGTLREVDVLLDTAHFEHDTAEVLPLGITWFGALEQRKTNPVEFKRVLSAIADAGYQYARVLFAVAGGYGRQYWDGHEVAPHNFTTEDGLFVEGWSDYEAQVVALGQDFAAEGVQVFVSSGGLNHVFALGDGRSSSADQLTQMSAWSKRLGELLKLSEVGVSFIDVNEVWQNWVFSASPTPADVYQYVIQPFEQGYTKSLISLRSAPYSGETVEGFNLWAGDIIQKHGHRGHFAGDNTSVIRHARGIFYDDGTGIPTKRLGIESEPIGPRSSVESMTNPEALAMVTAANFTGGFAHVFHSGSGVRHWFHGRSIDQEPGFLECANVYKYLPTDQQSNYTVRLHGGRSESCLTDDQGFPTENRVDTVVTSDGTKFVGLVYGDGGFSRIRANVDVTFSVITPHTGAATSFALNEGQTLDVYYDVGRVLVGEIV